jgi:1-deoxy-D-xylulose-5-phosphate reductoisomerase
MSAPRKGLAILGSTGSIGRQTLDVVIAHPELFSVEALAAGRTSEEFRRQLATWPDARAWTAEPDTAPENALRQRWADGGLSELATLPGVDLVVVATSGSSALPAVLDALRARRRVALANKETLVTGGHLVSQVLDELEGDRLSWLRPIDSEHSAIWQCLLGERLEDVTRVILTASGGPFRGRSQPELASVTPAEALAHPTWRMGPKITVDSATLVNKAFEAIEARWLYRIPYSRIEAVLHPSSVVHSLVEFVDGSFKAQLGLPDMHLPIQYALTFPERATSPARRASPAEWGALEFQPLRTDAYPAYWTVRQAAADGGNRGAVVNAADEVAVAGFLGGAIAFDRIPQVIAGAVNRWGSDSEPDLAAITALDAEVRSALLHELGVEAVV